MAAEESNDDTFKILLLVVGVLLLIVSGLLLANTWVTRKHVNANEEDQNRLRILRLAQRATRLEREAA